MKKISCQYMKIFFFFNGVWITLNVGWVWCKKRLQTAASRHYVSPCRQNKMFGLCSSHASQASRASKYGEANTINTSVRPSFSHAKRGDGLMSCVFLLAKSYVTYVSGEFFFIRRATKHCWLHVVVVWKGLHY